MVDVLVTGCTSSRSSRGTGEQGEETDAGKHGVVGGMEATKMVVVG